MKGQAGDGASLSRFSPFCSSDRQISFLNDYSDEYSQRLLRLAKTGRWLGTTLLAEEAVSEGASIRWHGSQLCVASFDDGREVLLRGHRSGEASVAAAIQRDKHLTKRLLREAGVASPRGFVARTASEAVEAMAKLGGSVVVKPRFGLKGNGITVGVSDREGVEAAFRLSRKYGSSVIVEEHIRGEEYRGIGSPGQCVSVLKRLPPNVEGDGLSTIRELIAIKNSHRRGNPHLYNRPIRIDEGVVGYLRSQQLTLDSVLPVGAHVTVNSVGNFSVGGDHVEVSHDVGVSVREVTRRALSSIPGLAWGGVDLIVEGRSGKPYVLEINTGAALSGHRFPVRGRAVNVAAHSWRIQKDRSAVTELRVDVAPPELARNFHGVAG